MSTYLDTNVVIRHLTGDPLDQARVATEFLRTESDLVMTDVIAAETTFVLETRYLASREHVAQALRSLVALRSVSSADPALLLRAVEVYESDRLHFPEAYLVACAERTDACRVASFDKAIDRVQTVRRIEPGKQARRVDTRGPGPMSLDEALRMRGTGWGPDEDDDRVQ